MPIDDEDFFSGLDISTEFGERKADWAEQAIWRICDWSRLPQRLRQKLRKRYARKVTGPFDVVMDGMKLRLYPAENHCDRIIFGRRELPEAAEHMALIPYLKPGMVFVDIGANIGSYSVFVGNHAGGDLTLLAFEPHPRTHAKLQYNLAANRLPVENVFNCGVGLTRDVLQLWSDGGSNIGHTSMLKEGTSNPKVSVDVAVVPLFEILSERSIENIDLLKIDIEGFEDRALASFFDDAGDAQLPKHVLIETAHRHLWQRDVVNMMLKRGYQVSFETPENLLLSRG